MKSFQVILASLVLAAVGAAANARSILLIEDQSGFGSAASVLTSNGFSVTTVNNEFANGYANLLNPTFLAAFDFVVYGEKGAAFGSVLPIPVASSLNNYILGGGDLLVTGYDTLGSPTDTNLARLLRLTRPADRVSGDPVWNVSNINHPILNGPFGDFRGVSFSATGYDDDNFGLGVGTVALASMADSSERLTFNDLPGVGGSVGYWNGGLSGLTTNAQPDFSDGGNPQNIFLNWASFATIPEPSTLTLTLASLGLLISRRRRK